MRSLLNNRYIIIGLILILLISVSGTYALWKWTGNTSNISVTVDAATVEYVKGPDMVNIMLKPTYTKEEGIYKEIKVKLNKSASNVKIDFYLDIISLPDALKNPTFKYEMYKGTTLINSGDFSDVIEGSSIELTANQNVTTTQSIYSLYVWIDGTYENPPSMGGRTFTFKLRATGVNSKYQEYTTSASCFGFETATKRIIAYYNYENNNSSNPPCPKDIIIPTQINGVDVEQIMDHGSSGVFQEKNITSVVFPNTMKRIGDRAFFKNKIAKLVIPEGVIHIGWYSFRENLLTDLSLPQSLLTMGTEPFSYNKLISVVIPGSLKRIPSSAFYRNYSITNVTIPEGIEYIEHAAFQSNKLETINLPSTLKEIGQGSFSNNLLTSLYIPDSVTKVGPSAFQNNKLENIRLHSYITEIGGGAFNNNLMPDNKAIIYKRNPDGTENSSTIVSYSGAQRSDIVVPSNITVIGDNAYNSNGITNITLHDNITTIEMNGLRGNELTSINLPSNLTTIGQWALEGNNLTGTLVIPSNVTTISDYVFYKRDTSNANLTKLINQTGQSHNWGNIFGATTTPQNFIVGTVIHQYGNIQISES